MSNYSDVAKNIATTLVAAGGQVAHEGATERLMTYWSTGKGGIKIRWPEPCAYCRCLEHLGKYVHAHELHGLCANLEKRATGHWPNPTHSRQKHCPC